MNSNGDVVTIVVLRMVDYPLFFMDGQPIKVGATKEVFIYGRPDDCHFKCLMDKSHVNHARGRFWCYVSDNSPWYRELSPLELLAMEADDE